MGACARHGLRKALLDGTVGDKALERVLDWRVALAEVSLIVTCDASPWGIGAILSDADGNPLEWLACPVSPLDCKILGVTVGDCRGQAVLEALALLVALRTWAPRWCNQRVRAHVRSDNTAALGAVQKLASPTANVNLVAREVALDVAASAYGLEATSWGHISGALNDWADSLSRLTAPEKKTVPKALAAVPRAHLAVRGLSWWRTRLKGKG